MRLKEKLEGGEGAGLAESPVSVSPAEGTAVWELRWAWAPMGSTGGQEAMWGGEREVQK